MLPLSSGCANPLFASQPLPTLVPTAVYVPLEVSQASPSPLSEPTPTLAPELLQPTFTPKSANSNLTVDNPAETAVTETPTVFDTPTPIPTATPVPTETPIPTVTPTSLPLSAPVLWVTDPILPEGRIAETAVPTRVPRFQMPESTTNILLLGNDGGVNTDTMMIVTINPNGPTASIISLPRDLYVYIPGSNMGRLNTAVARGGVDLLKQTILYNFGVPIHYYAQINFEGFQEAVDILNGVEIAVSCRLQDWRLASPELDPELEESWVQFALEPGVYRMDGDLALWYARSRKTTSDFDRGRRQQQLIRAIFTQAVDLDLVTEVPTIWNAYQDYIETDMDMGRMLQLATLAPAVRNNGVQHLYLAGKTESWVTPSGSWVLLPIWEGPRMMEEEFSRLFLPPAINMAERPPIFVEVVNASGNPDMTELAVDNLAWFGFVPVVGETAVVTPNTVLNYHKPNFKGSYDWLISWVFDMNKEQINLAPDDSSPYDYQLVIGQDYNPCRPQLSAPQLFLNR
ncbi:MAG: LCP family protein [Chloroflexota bacterium]